MIYILTMNRHRPKLIFKICYFLIIMLLLVNCNRERKDDNFLYGIVNLPDTNICKINLK